jgi:hypothetical protein
MATVNPVNDAVSGSVIPPLYPIVSPLTLPQFAVWSEKHMSAMLLACCPRCRRDEFALTLGRGAM